MGAEQLIELYNTARIISLIVLIAGAALAVFLFIRFDIRTIYGIRSGKAQKKMVQQMKDQNMLTGKLRREIDFDDTTEGLAKSGKTGKSGRFSRSEKIGKSGRTSGSGGQPAIKHSGNTGSFHGERGKPVEETGILKSPESDPLAPAPAVFRAGSTENGNQPYNNATSSEMGTEENGTTALWGSPTLQETTALEIQPSFVLTEHIMVVHTSEEI